MRHVAEHHDSEKSKPISEPVVLILLSLADQPRHGYALLKDISAMSQGRVQLTTGTLYGALRRLLEDTWIEKFEQDDKSRDKQAYCLTEIGRKRLQTELARMNDLTRAARARMKTREA